MVGSVYIGVQSSRKVFYIKSTGNTASVFRVDDILTLKIKANCLKSLGGPLVVCEPHVW
jgi:hypothetical protein